MFWWKPGILIPSFVSLQNKIPTNINQNIIIKLQQNHIYFSIIFAKFYNFFHIYKYIYIYINNTKYNIYVYIINIKSGWAGPNHDGPRSAQKILGRSRPKKFSSGPNPAQKTGLGQDPPGPATKRAGGELISPPPLHAERYSFCMQRRK
jgi:hypothetical protein